MALVIECWTAPQRSLTRHLAQSIPSRALCLQVLLMPEGDAREYQEEFAAAAEARGPSCTEPAAGILGRACLEDEDFREAVCMALLRAVGAALKRYPTTTEQDVALLAGAQEPGALPWRQRCAVCVRLGEKRLLHRLKADLLAVLEEGGAASSASEGGTGSGSSEEDDSGADSEDGSEPDSAGAWPGGGGGGAEVSFLGAGVGGWVDVPPSHVSFSPCSWCSWQCWG